MQAMPLPPHPEQGLLFSCKYGMTQGESLEERLLSAKEAGMDGVDFDGAASVTPEQLRAAAAAVLPVVVASQSVECEHVIPMLARQYREARWIGGVVVGAS